MPRDLVSSDTFQSLSMRARLVWYDLVLLTDREGRVSGVTTWLKSQIAPLDKTLTAKGIERAIEELVEAGLLERYVAEARTVLQFVQFADTQPSILHLDREGPSRLPDPPNSRLERRSTPELDRRQLQSSEGSNSGVGSRVGPDCPPLPSQTLPSPPERVLGGGELLVLSQEHSPAPPVVPPSLSKLPTVRGEIRTIRKLRGGDLMQGLAGMLTSLQVITYAPIRKEDEEAAFALLWFGYWMAKVGSRDDLLDDSRDALIRRRYVECQRDGDLMLYVVDGCTRDDFRMGRDPRKGDDPRLRSVRSLLKNFETMQELARKGGWVSNKTHPLRGKYAAVLHPNSSRE